MFISLAVKPDLPAGQVAGCCACNAKPDKKNDKKSNANWRDALKRGIENLGNMI
jgi:hypothetical protein